MKNNTKLAYAALAVFASSAYAADEVPKFNGKGKASVEVRNTLDIVETASLNFGTIAAVAGNDANPATLVLNPGSGKLTAASVTAADSGKKVGSITSIDETGVSPGVFTVSNAAKHTDLTIDLTQANPVELKVNNAPPGALTFKLADFKVLGNEDKVVDLSNGKARTDGNGNLVLKVGATLSTVPTTSGETEPYLDEEYTGEYAVTIKY